MSITVGRLIRDRDTRLRPPEVRLETGAPGIGRVVEESPTGQEHHEVSDWITTPIPPDIDHQALMVRVLAHHLLEGRTVGPIIHPWDMDITESASTQPSDLLLIPLDPPLIEESVLLTKGDRLDHYLAFVPSAWIEDREEHTLTRLPIQEGCKIEVRLDRDPIDCSDDRTGLDIDTRSVEWTTLHHLDDLHTDIPIVVIVEDPE